MEFDLLIFWIENMNFFIKYSPEKTTLYIRLKSCKYDQMRSCYFPLCSDKNKILDFFGYDSSLDYDHMKIYNQYEYICTSTKLSNKDIKYCGFKGPSAKNKNHANLNKYLLAKYHENKRNHLDNSIITAQKKIWLEKAIIFFNMESKYTKYIENQNILDEIFIKKNILKANYTEFKKFVCLYGVLNILKWDETTLQNNWNLFNIDEWNKTLSIFEPESIYELD
jgi:hypothetical protein